ncbi:hypothetical protein DV515_00016508 [Chloebia gouldiae]|uniref:Ig-like domain-containing protein n=1 Tax=Chloebia gouldiae TaxID=44316 RepID=A0A3L8RTP0_CHLGU|nr:hypothetical protein DV515_00016508 [Chloebia gouldiae]
METPAAELSGMSWSSHSAQRSAQNHAWLQGQEGTFLAALTLFHFQEFVLRDQRYKLLRYSKDELSIQLSNLTVQDAGIYKCFYYRGHIQNKSQTVEILAAPSHPVLEVSQDEGRGIKLSCYTHGGRPQPQISWLLDNRIELPGDTRHQLGADGKKWSTRSTLRILSCSPQVTASCVTQHPALGARRLVASLHLQDLPSTGCKQGSRLSEDAEVPSPSENPAVSNSPENPAGTSPSASPENPGVSSPSSSPENPEVSSPSTSPENPGVSSPSSPENPGVSSPFSSPENPEVCNSCASPENPGVSSPSASPDDPGVSNSSASPENPAVPSSAPLPAQPNLTDVTSNAGNPKSNVQYVTEGPVEPSEKDPETPGKDPQTSEKDPETPGKDPETPEEDPEIPEEDAQTPGKDPETPEEDPKTPEKDPETPGKDAGDETRAGIVARFPWGRQSRV